MTSGYVQAYKKVVLQEMVIKLRPRKCNHPALPFDNKLKK